MQKVSVQALNECFNVSGPDYIEMSNDYEDFDYKCLSSFASKAGKISAEVQRENQIGIFSLTKEDRVKNGRKGGLISGNNNKKNKTGFCGRSKEKMSIDGRKAGKTCYEKKVGIFAKTKEELSAQAAKVNSQRWKCLVTGFVTNAGTLSRYQKARGIDTSQRVRVE